MRLFLKHFFENLKNQRLNKPTIKIYHIHFKIIKTKLHGYFLYKTTLIFPYYHEFETVLNQIEKITTTLHSNLFYHLKISTTFLNELFHLHVHFLYSFDSF